MEATTWPEALRWNSCLGRPGDHAGRNASERRAGLETCNAEADPTVSRGRLPLAGKRATRALAGSAGVVAAARMEEGEGSNTGSPVGGEHTPTGPPRGAGWAGRVADGLVVPVRPGNAGGGKEPWFESDTGRRKGMTTGESLPGSEHVRRLRTVLHAKAKEEPDRRFHAPDRQGVARGLSRRSLEAGPSQRRHCRGGRRELCGH